MSATFNLWVVFYPTKNKKMTLYKVSYSTRLLFVYAIDIEDLYHILLDTDKDIYGFEDGLLYEKTTGVVENVIIKEIKKEPGIIWKQ